MNPFKNLFKPSPDLVAAARQRAEQESRERGIPIDRICVRATRRGDLRVIVLDTPVNTM